MSGFLSGYRVLDLTDHRGLLAGKMLADLGADVIAIEPPKGSPARKAAPLGPDGQSFYWAAYAAGKRSVICDLETPEGQAQFLRLVASADFLIESHDVEEARRLGIDYEQLEKLNTRLIHVSIRGFGDEGPKADYAHTDLTLWAAGGALFGTRDEGKPPVRVSVPQAYLHAAADAAGGALIALFARHQTGRGQHVRIDAQKSVAQATLSAVLAEAVGDEAYQISIENAANDSASKKLDLSGSGSATQRKKSWVVKDGEVELHLAMGPTTGKFTNNLFQWIRDIKFSNAPPVHWDWTAIHKLIETGEITAADIDDAHAVVRDFLKDYTRTELIDASLQRKLLIAPRLAIADLASSRHFDARGIFHSVRDSAGHDNRIVGLPVRFSTPQAIAPTRAAPLPGEHDAEINAELENSKLANSELATPVATPILPTAGAPAKPFAGLKVLDLSWVVAGPMIGRVLADFGANVVRVESSRRVDAARILTPFEGGERGLERSAVFQNCNAGKLGVTLDLAKAEALEVLRDLVRWCDVVVESYSFGTMKKWGMDYAGLRAINPGVILVSSTLMGQTGPYAALAGFGNLGSAMAGVQALVGWPDRQPRGPFGPYTDYVGPRFGLAALLAALDARRSSGEGCHIDVSQAECGLQFLAPALTDYFATGRAKSASGNDDEEMFPHDVFACAANGALRSTWVAVAAQSDDAWRNLSSLIGLDDLATLDVAQRRKAQETIDAALSRWCAARTAHQAEAELQRAGIAAHAVSTFRDFSHDTQLLHDRHILTLPQASIGQVHVEATRYALSQTPGVTDRPGPALGEHNEHVLSEILGYAPDRIAKLQQAGLLA
jgi:crotonobetainyl-CoA:carnitine CoA-transferase CaiB-like acyl-CoA transferase